MLTRSCVLLLITYLVDGFIRFGKHASEDLGLHNYMVIVNIRPEADAPPSRICGGVLLTAQVIYTACHCVSMFDARAGQQRVLTYGGEVQVYAYKNLGASWEWAHADRPRAMHIRYPFTRVYVPKEGCLPHGGLFSERDYALVMLDKPLDFGELGENLICTTANSPTVPMLFFSKHHQLNHAELLRKGPCFLAGFGLEEVDKLDEEDYLKYTWVRKVSFYSFGKVFEVAFDSKEGMNSGACKGDSGSSLICIHDGMPFTMGVVSGGTTNHTAKEINERQLKKLKPETITCRSRREFAFFSSLGFHYKDIVRVMENEFKIKEADGIEYWQGLCKDHYKDFGYLERKQRFDDELPRGCFFCRDTSNSIVNIFTFICILLILIF